MTALAELARADRQRLEERLAELRGLDRLMREPGTLAAPREDREIGQSDQRGDTTSVREETPEAPARPAGRPPENMRGTHIKGQLRTDTADRVRAGRPCQPPCPG